MALLFALAGRADHHYGCIQFGSTGQLQHELREGESTTFSIALCNRPTATVTITPEIQHDNPQRISVSPASLVLTIGAGDDYWGGNWHLWHTFTVTYPEDSHGDGNRTAFIRPMPDSDDERYTRAKANDTGGSNAPPGTGQGAFPVHSFKLIDNDPQQQQQNQIQQQKREPLPRPHNLRHLGNGAIAWDAVPNASGYQVLVYEPTAYHRASGTQFNIPNLSAGKEYNALVRALGDGDIYPAEGSWSSILKFTIAAQQPEPQEPPQQRQPQQQQTQLGTVRNLSVSATADTITVSWDPPSEGTVTRYIAHIKPQNGDKGDTKRPKANKTSVTFKNLKSGVEYKVWVRAMNDIQKGERTHHQVTTQ